MSAACLPARPQPRLRTAFSGLCIREPVGYSLRLQLMSCRHHWLTDYLLILEGEEAVWIGVTRTTYPYESKIRVCSLQHR